MDGRRKKEKNERLSRTRVLDRIPASFRPQDGSVVVTNPSSATVLLIPSPDGQVLCACSTSTIPEKSNRSACAKTSRGSLLFAITISLCAKKSRAVQCPAERGAALPPEGG